MSAQKVHRMKLRKAASGAPVTRRDKKQHSKGQPLLFQHPKEEDEGEASMGLLSNDGPVGGSAGAALTQPTTANKQESKPSKLSIRKVFGFGRKAKKPAGYTLSQTPKIAQETLPDPAPIQHSSNDIPTGITPKHASSPFHKSNQPKPSIYNDSAQEERPAASVTQWNANFSDDLFASESKGGKAESSRYDDEGNQLEATEDSTIGVAPTSSIEVAYSTDLAQAQTASPKETISVMATSPKSTASRPPSTESTPTASSHPSHGPNHGLESSFAVKSPGTSMSPVSSVGHKSSMSPVATVSPVASVRSNKSTVSPVASTRSYKSIASKQSSMVETPQTKSPKKSPKTPKSQSPAARAAALAIVEVQDDIGENDFDPDKSSSDEEDDIDDKTDMISTGPQSQDSSSAFQFNLAADNMKNSAPITATNSSSPASMASSSKALKSESSDGFQILMTRSSCSKSVGVSRRQSSTQTTVASSTSMLSNLSLREKDSATSPSVLSQTSNTVKSNKRSPSGSTLSRQTSNSSSIFPSSSTGSSTPKSTLSRHDNNDRRNGQSYATNATSALSDHSSLPRGGSPMAPSLSNSPKRQQAKLVLSRPFGRHSLPLDLQPWKVEVSPAEWDSHERCWKYRIQVQRRQASQQPQSPSSKSFTWRSLENFVWLEEALNNEFQGGLVLPLLNIAVGMNDLAKVTHEVDAALLRDWLSDILNGVRGQGELLLQHKSIDLHRSLSVEAFLYRNTAPLQKPGNLIMSIMGDSIGVEGQKWVLEQQRMSTKSSHHHFHYNENDTTDQDSNFNNAMYQTVLHSQRSQSTRSQPFSPYSQQLPEDEQESFVDSLWRGPLALMTGELCGVGGCNDLDDSPSSAGSSVSSPGAHKKFERLSCASRALGTADTLDIQDSFIDVSTVASLQSSARAQGKSPLAVAAANQPPRIWRMAQFPTLIKAERDLVLSYRKTALCTMERAEILLEEESNIGKAWKRFGIAVSNLFSYEKEVESARLGDKKVHRDNMPYRKVKKSTIDEGLRILAQQKMDRSGPPIRALRAMLTAYIADLSAVAPSVEAYLEGISQMALFDEVFDGEQESEMQVEESSANSKSPSTQHELGAAKKDGTMFENFQEQIRSLAAPVKMNEEKKTDDGGHILRTSSASSTTTADEHQDKSSSRATELQRKRVVEDRILVNERLLKDSLTTLCKSANIRTARIAWAFFKSESTQCSLLYSAAKTLRSNIEVPNKQAVAEMLSRHGDENKEDMKTELALVQRMVNLGNMKKYPLAGAPPSGDTETIEVDSDNQDEERSKALLRDNALQIARERVGRWNSQLAMAVMKAIGVDDPNVRVEETSRELRLVRKYAIGLRENLNRCIEAVDLLRNTILKGQYTTRQDNNKTSPDRRKTSKKHISETRKEYYSELAKLLSGIYISHLGKSPRSGLSQPSLHALKDAGVKTDDPFGWSTPFSKWAHKSKSAQGLCGMSAFSYVELKDTQTEWMLTSLSNLLNEYTQRVEVVESFVYMECVGVQIEKYFSEKRAKALSAFEKKTDVTTAINIATRKRVPGLVEELQAKLEKFGPEVSHTSVKEAKEAHLESKHVKSELHELALRRLLRAKETSTERVISLLQCWVREEESACISELNTLGEVLDVLEKAVGT